ncbi:MAG: HDOD domain-containing protein [Pseudomonadota bacterium]|nr:HDOD domain-containing protein [Pseudomonadota bacterium]
MNAPGHPNARLGRFELLSELGRGAQAVVWLAHDTRLDREVALKLLNPASDAQAADVQESWLDEARAVSRLSHPNIVPVFEADTHDGRPYLVFEYVEGPTLAQARRSKPVWPARDAVALLLGVLDALAVAHEQGLVHRDLKPSNVLLGNDGRPRVMDFGIAARVSRGDGRIVGTPGYMSPEAARGEAPIPAMDVFAAGVLLGELLCGEALLRETDPMRAVERVQHEDLQLPAAVPCDDVLRSIVQRALARDCHARFDSARSMHQALTAWIQPQEAATPSGEAGATSATLEFLLRRMRHKTDFPALSASVVRIQRVASSETESLRNLSDEVMQDVALTNKLLRMVNTAHFSTRVGGGVSTVTRAVALVGFAGIRNMALSVLLLEHMGDKAHANQLKEEFLRALMAGTLAGELAPLAGEGEDAYLAAMFQNLGRLLTEFYFADEAMRIRQVLGSTADPLQQPTAERREAAAQQVLGIGFEELGVAIARSWGLPENLQKALRAPTGDVPKRPPERTPARSVERMRWLGRSANALTDALLQNDGEAQSRALKAAADLYAPVLGLSSRDLVDAAASARSRMQQLSQSMGIQVSAGVPARRLLEPTPDAAPDAATLLLSGADVEVAERTGKRVGAKVATPNAARVAETPVPGAAMAVLNAALRRLEPEVHKRSMPLTELLAAVLTAFAQAVGFRAVVFCLRDGASGCLLGRVAQGSGAEALRTAARIKPDASAMDDLFAVLCAKGSDLLVADAAAPTIAARLPTWFKSCEPGHSFLLLPLLHRQTAIGLIYADKEAAGSIVLAPAELALLRELRDLVSTALTAGKA